MLSDLERNQYVKDYIIPSFNYLVNHDSFSTLFDIYGKCIICTRRNMLDLGFTSQNEMIGLSYAEINDEMLKKLAGENYSLNMDEIKTSCNKIHELLLTSVKHKRIVKFIDLIPYNQHYRSFLETYTPILHPSGEVVAVQSMSIEFKMFDLPSLLDRNKEKPKSFSIPKDSPPLDLPPRQHEILYLLLQGIPQEYAAQILNIKRGTLARIVSENLCPKFGIHGSNTKLLIKKAQELGLQDYMPRSLWKPSVIILDKELGNLTNSQDDENLLSAVSS